jgi:hypothetical protein
MVRHLIFHLNLKLKRSPSVNLRLQTYMATQSLTNTFTYHQAQTYSLLVQLTVLFQTAKQLKQLLLIFLANANS